VLTARFMYLAVPTAVCLFSVVIGLFFGSFGPVRRRGMLIDVVRSPPRLSFAHTRSS